MIPVPDSVNVPHIRQFSDPVNAFHTTWPAGNVDEGKRRLTPGGATEVRSPSSPDAAVG